MVKGAKKQEAAKKQGATGPQRIPKLSVYKDKNNDADDIKICRW